MRKGFTLIELLVVVSIIGILSTIGLVVFGGTTSKARDSIRKNDLTHLGTALELYLQQKNEYVIGTDSCAGENDQFFNSTSGIAPFMSNSTIPKDPKTGGNYCYKSNVDGTSYSLTATLDDGTLYELKSEDYIASSGGGSCTQTIAQICSAAGKNCGSFSGSGVCSSVSGSCGTCSGTTPICTNNVCVACVTDGSCSAAIPACGQTTTGLDNCQNSCTRTGAACPPPPTIYVDNDNDSYGAGASLSSCPSGKSCVTNNQDCYDSNPNAKPGQTQYFSTQRGDGSYDYNCDNRAEKEYAYYGPKDNYQILSRSDRCLGQELEAYTNLISTPDCGLPVARCSANPYVFYKHYNSYLNSGSFYANQPSGDEVVCNMMCSAPKTCGVGNNYDFLSCAYTMACF